MGRMWFWKFYQHHQYLLLKLVTKSHHTDGDEILSILPTLERSIWMILPKKEPDEVKEERCFEKYFTKYLRIFASKKKNHLSWRRWQTGRALTGAFGGRRRNRIDDHVTLITRTTFIPTILKEIFFPSQKGAKYLKKYFQICVEIFGEIYKKYCWEYSSTFLDF